MNWNHIYNFSRYYCGRSCLVAGPSTGFKRETRQVTCYHELRPQNIVSLLKINQNKCITLSELYNTQYLIVRLSKLLLTDITRYKYYKHVTKKFWFHNTQCQWGVERGQRRHFPHLLVISLPKGARFLTLADNKYFAIKDNLP